MTSILMKIGVVEKKKMQMQKAVTNGGGAVKIRSFIGLVDLWDTLINF